MIAIVIDSSDGEDLPDGLLQVLYRKLERWVKREHRALGTRLAPCSAYKLDINATLSTDRVAIQYRPYLCSHETTPAAARIKCYNCY